MATDKLLRVDAELQDLPEGTNSFAACQGDPEGPAPVAFTHVLEDADFITAVKGQPWGLAQELLDMLQLGDVLLVCQGGKAVRCHHTILELTSPVFRGMLEATAYAQGCSTACPATLMVQEDQPEHWLYVLQYMYPLPSPAPPNLGNALALGLLSHKYDMCSRVQAAWQQFADRCSFATPTSHHFVFCIPNWSSRKKEVTSPTFEAAGSKWELEVYPRGHGTDKGTHLSVYLYNVCRSGWAHVQFQFIINSKQVLLPAARSKLLQKEFDSAASIPCLGQSQLIPLDKLSTYIDDDTLELLVIIVPTPAPGRTAFASNYWQLSVLPSAPGYVCKWLEVAGKVKHVRLKQACLAFIARNRAILERDQAYHRDACAAMACLEGREVLHLLLHGSLSLLRVG